MLPCRYGVSAWLYTWFQIGVIVKKVRKEGKRGNYLIGRRLLQAERTADETENDEDSWRNS